MSVRWGIYILKPACSSPPRKIESKPPGADDSPRHLVIDERRVWMSSLSSLFGAKSVSEEKIKTKYKLGLYPGAGDG